MYSDNESMYDDDENYDYNDSVDDPGSDAEEQPVPLQKTYDVLMEEDIRRRQADDVAKLSALLFVPPSSAAILLHRHRWSLNTVQEAWFYDKAQACESAGLVQHKALSVKSFRCEICLERYGVGDGEHAGCGHLFCRTCWRSYIGVSIEGGPGCLSLRCPCPNPPCAAAVDQDLVHRLGSDKDKEKYADYFFRSYIEENPKTKWCPSPGCQMAVELFDCSGNEGYDVLCKCSHRFCWNCMAEAHRPVDCSTVAKWITKNSSESENVNWILTYTKPCPNCKRAIEKSDGCMHMTCRAPCRYEFCWVCLGSWREHMDFACNRYIQEAEVTEKRRDMAKQSIMRYTHYYERWVANESSRVKASEDLFNLEAENLEKLIWYLSRPAEDFKFITEAWVQIVECRRALKWSYAYGYYIPEEEDAKRTFFKYLQGEAELGLERLHQCAENDLQGFLVGKNKDDFYIFRHKLKSLTSATQNYFEKLVKALENGLSDVGSCCSC